MPRRECLVVWKKHALRDLVDVGGLEPPTPCLQMRTENTMWLSFLAFTYVVIDGF